MEYHRDALHHLIERALKRNTFTATEPIRVLLLGEDVLLYGTVTTFERRRKLARFLNCMSRFPQPN